MDKFPFTRSATSAPPIAILGVPFDNVSTSEAIELIEQMVGSGLPHYLATANVDFLVQALHDVELRRILMDAHMVLCDGTPLVWASRLLGNPLPERVAGSDLVPLLIKIAEQKKYRVFFLGGTDISIKKAVDNLRQQHPDLIIAGHYSPPFLPLHEMNHEEVTRRIRDVQPDLLFVSFGCPKQEKWIAMHYRSLGVPVCIGVGGTIDFLAGTIKRAPKWMRKSGTEWLYRVAREPRRLCKRYLNDVAWFGQAIFRQWWQMHFAKMPGRKAQSASTEGHHIYRIIRVPEEFDIHFVRREAMLCEEALASCRHCAFDLQNVKFIDSSGMGLLIRLQKKARITGRQFLLVSPSNAVQSALKLMRLKDFFTIVRDQEEVVKIMETNIIPKGATRETATSSGFTWKGEVTAANVDEIWKGTETYISSCAKNGELRIDLSQVPFIDSTGLGLMIRTRKVAGQFGAKIFFSGAQPNVRNVLRIARLESTLLGAIA
jgi:N-acetylglucosaminyldiphosphoundecaprenol N-acetyl-beta-D-mannosaminyltransferase